MHPTLSPTVPPIAHHDAAPQAHIYTAVDNATARVWRQHYRAAIAWVDSQIGRVLAELDAQSLVASTLIVLHSDHGWSLGEHGEWQTLTADPHLSPLTSHLSPITDHRSPITDHRSPITHHPSPITLTLTLTLTSLATLTSPSPSPSA